LCLHTLRSQQKQHGKKDIFHCLGVLEVIGS
jgi:hypothetical protein